MTTLEEKLGYTFQNQALLENALTHSSCANESRGKLQSNERLEFLGDSILGMVVADHLYRNHPDLPEGELQYIVLPRHAVHFLLYHALYDARPVHGVDYLVPNVKQRSHLQSVYSIFSSCLTR